MKYMLSCAGIFCETVYDYCISNRDTDLMTTWNCIIESENKLHRAMVFFG